MLSTLLFPLKMIKRFFIVLSLLTILLCRTPISASAIYTIDSNISSSSASPSASATSSSTATPSATTNQSLWDKFMSFLFGLFVKTDYPISSRELTAINTDMNDYGDLSDSNLSNKHSFSDKHSFSGSRLTSANSQNCLKGNVIKQVILETDGYPDSELTYISTDSNCKPIKVSDLAHYFVQLQKQFYCDANNKLINTESNILSKINETFTETIPTEELSCYKAIYNDFYITPKDNTDTKEENAKKIVQTPLSASSQKQTLDLDTKAIKDQVDQNFTPANYSDGDGGLTGLRPANW